MLAQRKKRLASLSTIAAALAMFGALYAKQSSNWVPEALLMIGLLEWGLSTLWARSAARECFWTTGLVTFVNAIVAFAFVTVTTMVTAKNPDGVLYVVANITVYGLGSAIGGMFAMCAFPKK